MQAISATIFDSMTWEGLTDDEIDDAVIEQIFEKMESLGYTEVDIDDHLYEDEDEDHDYVGFKGSDGLLKYNIVIFGYEVDEYLEDQMKKAQVSQTTYGYA